MPTESEPVPAAEPATVMIADGDAAVRDNLTRLILGLGAQVHAYATAADLLAAVADGPVPAAIVADMRLPDMGGLDLMRELRRHGRRVPTILLSRDPDVSTAVSAMRAGAIDFLEKPAVDRVLLGHLARLLARDSGR